MGPQEFPVMVRFTGKGPKNQGCEERNSTPGGTNRLKGSSNPDLRCRQGKAPPKLCLPVRLLASLGTRLFPSCPSSVNLVGHEWPTGPGLSPQQLLRGVDRLGGDSAPGSR